MHAAEVSFVIAFTLKIKNSNEATSASLVVHWYVILTTNMLVSTGVRPGQSEFQQAWSGVEALQSCTIHADLPCHCVLPASKCCT